MKFHFLDVKTNEPVCGAPKSTHATKDVTKVPRCRKCLKIVREKFNLSSTNDKFVS